jgi:hypothetical protein
VADEAVIGLALEEGWAAEGGLLAENVEDGSEVWVDGGDFEDITGLAEAYVEFIIEIDGAWGLWRDATQLEAGFGEDEALRFDGDAEGVEEGLEVTGSGFVSEGDAAVVELLLEFGDAVGGLSGAVVDGWAFKVILGGCREGEDECGGSAEG